jgi:two-component system phosphate regulon sensor histidine kinase PhoR
VKRIFTIIIILITLSVAGIVVLQISWLNNMLLLREDQVLQKVEEAGRIVANELGQYKGSYPTVSNKKFPGFGDGFSLELTRPYTVGQRFTAAELHEKIKLVFASQNLEKIPFEFALAISAYNGELRIERKSEAFEAWHKDSLNHIPKYYALVAPPGSEGENLSPDEVLIIVVPNVRKFVYKSLRPNMGLALLFSLIIFAAFFLTIRTMLRQKKMSEIKNDFINNMTHEFKTPIATISLAVDALRNQKVQQDVAKMTYFSDIIKEENQRMNRQVETILKSALMDRQEVELNLKPLQAHQIIQDVADNFMLRLQEKGGTLELKLEAGNSVIEADEVHFSNLINNLMDNAVKYAREDVPPRIVLSTSSTAKKFIIRIEDNGIGMTRETVKRIFEKFYRAHTGNIHNVKGFGLGLSYVKDIIDAHEGSVKVDSVLGKGSCFTIEMPLSQT